MTEIDVGELTFHFSENSEATKYDDWEFYLKKFQRIKDGTKAVDIVCIVHNETWLIEVKDYRKHKRTKPSGLSEEIAGKVRDTLSGLAAANANAEGEQEREIARRAIGRRCWRVVLHLEQGQETGSALWPSGVDPAKLLQKIRGRLKAVDRYVMVRDSNSCPDEVPWEIV